MKRHLRVICATLVVSAGLASAQNYIYNAGDPDHNSVIDPGGLTYKSDIAFIDDFTLIYNPGNQQLNFTVKYFENSTLPDGFWFVLSDGPNPKDGGGQYAIFYFDATGSAAVSVYVYNGQNGASSHLEPGSFLASSKTNGALTASASYSGQEAAFAFSADVSGINGAAIGLDWEGARFGEKVGIWFHTVTFDEATLYNTDGSLSTFKLKNADFFDTDKGQMTIPESSVALLGSLGAGLLFRRKR